MFTKLKESVPFLNTAVLVALLFMFVGKDNAIDIGKFKFELKAVDPEKGSFKIEIKQTVDGEVSQEVIDAFTQKDGVDVQNTIIDTSKVIPVDTSKSELPVQE